MIHKIAVCLSRAVLADFYTTGVTVVLMGFALEPLDCQLHYESVITQLARSTPTAVEKAVLLDKASTTLMNLIVLLTY